MLTYPYREEAVRFGPFELDLRTGSLSRRGHQARLAVQPGRLLVLLVQRRGELVTRNELHSELWPGDEFGDFDHGLNNAVNRLREALGDSAATQRYIQTAPRRGYRFIGELEVVDHASTDGFVDSPPNQGKLLPIQTGISEFRVEAATASSALLRHGNKTQQVVDDHLAQEAPDPESGLICVAVSLLETSSGDASQDYFAEIVTEALMSELAQDRRLRVFPSSMIALQKNATSLLSYQVEAPQLNMLVEGSVVRNVNKVRVVVRLIQLPSQTPIWSQSYDRDLGEILALQKELAMAIRAQIHGCAASYEQLPFSPATIIKRDAFDWYLRGRFYAQHQNKADNESAMLSFERAVAIDPTFAIVHAELAQTYVWKLFLFAPHERQWQEKAFVSVEKALSLDPNLAVAYLARGRLLWTPANHFPHARAIRDYRRAVSLNPNLDEARNQLALIYCHIGYFEDALRESQAATLTNPNNHLAVYRTAQTLVFQGKHEAALSILRTIPRDVNPSLIGYQTAWVLFNLGRREEASALIEQLLLDHPEDDGALFISMQAVFAAAAGDRPLAESKIEASIKNGKGFGHFHHAAYHIAIAYALLRSPDQAIEWLDFASADGFPCYPLFETDPNLANISNHERFINFLTKLKRQWLAFRITDQT